MKSHDKWWQLVFASVLRVRPFREISAKHSVLPICHIWYTKSLDTHYIYPHIECSAFLRENPSHNIWELEIVIPTIFFTIHCGFPQLLPLHFQILERLIAQTFTTPILSVKWEDNVSLSQLVAGVWRAWVHGGRLGLEGLLLFMYSNLFSSGSIYCLEGDEEVFRQVFQFPLW